MKFSLNCTLCGAKSGLQVIRRLRNTEVLKYGHCRKEIRRKI